jgi:hypothetical protein
MSRPAREFALDCLEILKMNGDVNLSDGFNPHSPQIVDRIVTAIEMAILRKLEEDRCQTK